jgi:hypothetical protein
VNGFSHLQVAETQTSGSGQRPIPRAAPLWRGDAALSRKPRKSGVWG